MSEQSKSKINNPFRSNDLISPKKRSLQYDEDEKEIDKKIKLEQTKYSSELTKRKNESKYGNSATSLFKRLFFGKQENKENFKNNFKKEEISTIPDVEKEKYEDEIIELQKQCLAYENQIKNLSSINKLLTDKNIELLNAKKKFEFLLKERNIEESKDLPIEKNIIKSERSQEDIETINKQTSIIKSLKDTIKYYQITVEKQEKELKLFKSKCTCSVNKNLQNTNDIDTNNIGNIKGKSFDENKRFYMSYEVPKNEKVNIKENIKGEKDSVLSHTLCNTSPNDSEIANFINNENLDSKHSIIENNEKIDDKSIKNNQDNINSSNDNANSKESITNNENNEGKDEKYDNDKNSHDSIKSMNQGSKNIQSLNIDSDNNNGNNNDDNGNNGNDNINNNEDNNNYIDTDSSLIEKINISENQNTSMIDEIKANNGHNNIFVKKIDVSNGKNTLSTEEIDIKQLTNQYNDICNTCQILESVVEQKQNLIDEYEFQLRESKENINEQLEMINKLNSKIKNQELLLESNKHKIITLEAIIKEHTSIIKNSNFEIEKLEETIDKLEGQRGKDDKLILESQSLIEHHKSIADSAKTTLDHQKIIIQGLEKQLEKLQQSIIKKDREIEAMKSNIHVNESSNKNLKSSLEDNKLLLQKLENENKILKNEKNVLEMDIKSKQNDNENTIKIITKNNQYLENAIVQYKNDIQDLREKVIRMKIQCITSGNKNNFDNENNQNDSSTELNSNIKSIEVKVKRLIDVFTYSDELVNKNIIINEIKHFYKKYKLLIKSYVDENNDNKYKINSLLQTIKDTNQLLKDKEDLIKDYDSKICKLKLSLEQMNQRNLQLKGNMTINEKISSNHLARINKLEEIIQMYETIGEKEKEEKGEKDILYYKLELEKVKELYNNKDIEVTELNKNKTLNEQELEKLKNDYYQLENQYNKEKHTMEGLKEAVLIYEKIVSENQDHIDKLEKTNKELQSQLHNYEMAQKSSQDTLEVLEKRANQIENIINAYKESNEISKEKQSLLEKTIQDQTITIQEHEDTIQSMDILQKQLNNLEKINENQSSTIRSYETMIEDLRENFSNLRKKSDYGISNNTKSYYSSIISNDDSSNNNTIPYYSNLNDDTLHNINKKSFLDKSHSRYNYDNLSTTSIRSPIKTKDSRNITSKPILNNNHFKSSYYTPKKSTLNMNDDSLGKLSLNNTIYKTPINYQKFLSSSSSSSNLFNNPVSSTIYKTPYDYDIFKVDRSHSKPKRKNISQLLSEYQERENKILKTPIKQETIDEKSKYPSTSSSSYNKSKVLSLNLSQNNVKSRENINITTPYNQKYKVRMDGSILSSNSTLNNDNNNGNSMDISSSPSFYTPPSQTQSPLETSNKITNLDKKLNSWSESSPSLKFNKK